MPKVNKGKHPSKDLDIRSQGFGVASGYEKTYNQKTNAIVEVYGPIPHSGYYGTGIGQRPFKIGQAGFSEETSWYKNQYGELTANSKSIKKPDGK
ncbi:MAG: hypothetical protein HY231_25555 [Acidobacteria bacterium]|nr:hypothetical protein [Acidobacteriota bacterium]